MRRYLALVALLLSLAVQGCNGTSTSAPGNSCQALNDNVTVNSATVAIANVTYPPHACQVIGPNVDVQASSNGVASANFSGEGICNLYQGPPTVAGSPPKTGDYTARPPGGGLLYLNNAAADCTLTSTGMISVCGYGTLFSDSSTVGLSTNCNTDPILNVSVYRGSVRVNIPKLGGASQRVMAGYAVTFDPRTLRLTTTTAVFTKEQVATFDAQLDSMLFRVTPGDFTSFLRTPALSPSNNVYGPDIAQQQLGARYGSIAAMCAIASVPIVFFPTDPYGKLPPQLYAGLCTAKTATLYGVAIYQPKGLAYGGTFYQMSGGGFIASQTFSKTLEYRVPTPLITWNGQFGESFATAASQGKASPGIYVAKFVYSLGSDSTPRISLVAFSFQGASYPPPVIQ